VPFFGEINFIGFDSAGRPVFGFRDSSNGSGDLYFGTKFRLINPDTHWFSMALGGYVKPSGRIAIIEMNKDDPNTPHKSQPELLVSRDDIMKWMSDAGFKLVQEHADLFRGTKWFLIFGKK